MTTPDYLDCTEDHPVFVVGRGYVPAADLVPGDTLLTADGPCKVETVEELPDIPEFVYNLSTEPHHNFFANGVLVHNCDDPIDPKRAVSEAELKTAADFVTNILPSRKVDKAVAVTTVIMQRLHSEDPTGILLAKAKQIGGVERIRHICLPARLADNVLPAMLRDRYTEGLMDPDRLPEVVLREQEILLGAYAFSGQYQQSPVPLTGGMFNISYFSNRVKAAPYNCQRIRYWDRACLTAGTLITTAAGPKAIERVQAGDTVLTRQGFKKVKWAGETKRVNELIWVAFANGSVIMGTPEHRIWTGNRGWIELASISGSDYNLQFTDWRDSWFDADASGSPIRKSFNSTALPTLADPASGISSPTVGIKCGSGTGLTPCTGPSGVSITATYPVAMMSITETETGPITRLRILNACPELSTTGDTIPLPPGTQRTRPASSGSGILARLGGMLRTVLTSVFSADRNLLRDVLTCLPSSARPSVVNATASVKNQSSVSSAARNSGDDPVLSVAPPSAAPSSGPPSVLSALRRSEENSRSSGFAPSPAGPSGSIPVYDLEVEDAHEFFANGVLVHNSTQDGGCYTAGVLLAQSPDGFWFVEHVVHGQWEPDRRNQEMKACAVRDRARYGSHEPLIYIEAEGGSSGRDSYKGVLRALAGFSVREHRPTGRKEVRAEPWACQLASGNVHIVESGWDIENYIQEHIHFPLGKYKDQVDSSCLAKGSLISTEMGLRPIESIQAGQRVLTRQGYCEVEWAGQSGESSSWVSVLFANGSIVTGTLEHLLLTQARGWITLFELCADDLVYTDREENHTWPGSCELLYLIRKWSSSMANSTVADRASTTSGEEESPYTELLGNSITATFPLAMIFTTRTGTVATTGLKILNAFLKSHIAAAIETPTALLNNWLIWRQSEPSQQLGISLRLDEPGTENTGRRPGKAGSPRSTSAFSASKNFGPLVQERETVVPSSARLSVAAGSVNDLADGEIEPRNVLTVIASSKALSELHIVHEFVPIGHGPKIPVYDLKVRAEHEFFANGILVHNSGAFALLTQQRPAGGLRSYRLQHHRKKGLQVILCSPEQLTGLELTRRCLLIYLKDPDMVKGVMSDVSDVRGQLPSWELPRVPELQATSLGKEVMPAHGLPAVLDSLTLEFLPNSPADFQETWDAILPDYGQTAEGLLLSRDKAKRFWAFTTRHRDPWAEAVVLVDDNEQRLLAAGLACCDGLGLPRNDTLAWTGRDSWQATRETKAEAVFIYEQLRAGRNLVV